ncbi:MAG: hypothetical protein ACI4R8_05180 [Candidatus Caccovivens sp.]
MNCREEEMILFATSIAMELGKGLSLEELEDLKALINQIQCSLVNLIVSKYNTRNRLTKNDKH